jgi:3-phenylpropionate/trans-cinnamate dioxygenase ferredoxin subunit
LTIEVCSVDELPPGSMRLIALGALDIGVYNCGGELYALEDRCSHDDGPLCEGDWEEDECVVVCPRHGSRFDITSGRPLTLPAYLPVETYPVSVRNGMVVVEVPDYEPGPTRSPT